MLLDIQVASMPGRTEEKDHISQAASDALSRPAELLLCDCSQWLVGFKGNLLRLGLWMKHLGDCDFTDFTQAMHGWFEPVLIIKASLLTILTALVTVHIKAPWKMPVFGHQV